MSDEFEGFESANTTPVPDVCWICRWPNQLKSDLCYPCYHDLLNKIVRQKKRARVKGAEATLTTAQWIEKLRTSQGCCYYCRKFIGYRALTLEHLVPVAKGGGTTAENCVPACMDCNAKSWRVSA